MVHNAVAEAYDRMAAGYDAHDDTPQFLAEDNFVYREMIQPHVKMGRMVFDLGCGTGRALYWLDGIEPGRYCGVDISQGMLERARKKFPGHMFRKMDMRLVTPQPDSLVFSLYGSPCYMSVVQMAALLLRWEKTERFFLVYGKGRNKKTYTAQRDGQAGPLLYGREELDYLKHYIRGVRFTGVDMYWYNNFFFKRLYPWLNAIRRQAVWSQKRSLWFMEKFAWVMVHVPAELGS